MLVPHPPTVEANGSWPDGRAATFVRKGSFRPGRWEIIRAQSHAAGPDGKQKTETVICVF